MEPIERDNTDSHKSCSKIEQSIFGEFLSPSSLAALNSISDTIEMQPGDYLFREGQENRTVYTLLKGQLDLAMTVPGRGPTRILTLGRGDLVAWSAVLGDGIMTASAVCVEAAQLSSVDCKLLMNMIESNPTLGIEFMKMMATGLSKRLLATRLQLLDLFASNT